MKVNQFTYNIPSQDILDKIQNEYDKNEISINDICIKFNISFEQIKTLRKKGLLNFNRTKKINNLINSKKSLGRKHTEETKKKLSEIRKKWMRENRDKAGYILSHKSRGESYAERYFRLWLEKENILFQQEYHFGLYQYDFLVNERVDLEIDGSQHRNDKRIVEHDKKRDKKSKEAGFIVHRIFWSDYTKLSQLEKESYLSNLKKFLNDSVNNPIPEIVIKNREKIKKKKTESTTPKSKNIFVKHEIDSSLYQYDYIELMAIELYENGYIMKDIGTILGVRDATICRWLKKHNVQYGKRQRKFKNFPKIKIKKESIKNISNVYINYIPYMLLELLEGGYNLKEASGYMGLQPNISAIYLKQIDINSDEVVKKRDLILPHNGMNLNLDIRDTSKEKFDKKQQAIKLLKEGYSYVSVGKMFNVSDNAIRKWVKSMNVDPKTFQFYKNDNRKFF